MIPPEHGGIAMNQLKQQIAAQLRRRLVGHELRIGEALLDVINDAGYLELPFAEVRAAVDARAPATPVQLLGVLHEMQRMDPPGFGAADLCDRLMIQYEIFGAARLRSEPSFMQRPDGSVRTFQEAA
jgi:DNA-directed RNA polymerase specialized sigma54-like protein